MSNTDYAPNALLIYPPLGLVRIDGLVQEGEQAFYSVTPLTQPAMTVTTLISVKHAVKNGLRPLSDKQTYRAALKTLRYRKRGLFHVRNKLKAYCKETWEARINSGDMRQLARVVRDLSREKDEPKRSDLERDLYEKALLRLSAEAGALSHMTTEAAREKIERILGLSSWGVAEEEACLPLGTQLCRIGAQASHEASFRKKEEDVGRGFLGGFPVQRRFAL